MKNQSKHSLQFRNFQSALNKLIEFVSEPVINDRDRAGIIQAFEFTFEQCWKYFQKKAESQGEQVPGPKPSLEVALRYEWIQVSDESVWLGMLRDRNMTSHLYRDDVSHAVFERVIKDYISLLKKVSE